MSHWFGAAWTALLEAGHDQRTYVRNSELAPHYLVGKRDRHRLGAELLHRFNTQAATDA